MTQIPNSSPVGLKLSTIPVGHEAFLSPGGGTSGSTGDVPLDRVPF